MCIFCSERCMHFGTSVLDNSAWAGVYATLVCFYANVHICEHTRCRLCTYVYMMMIVYMCVYACTCIRMRMCVYDIVRHVEVLLLRFSICAYVCICMRMYMCVHVCVYRCMCLCDDVYENVYVCVYECIHIYTYIYIVRARVGVNMHSCKRILFIVLSNLSITCVCITGVL